MRALALASTLIVALAAPALAHDSQDGAQGLHLSDLILTFDPLTQSQVFSFELANDDDGPAGGLFASVTLLDDQLPNTAVRVGSGLPSGTSAHFDVSVPLRISPAGCIHVYTTAIGHDKMSNRECSTSSGLMQAPLLIPTVPDLPAPEVPEPPTLP